MTTQEIMEILPHRQPFLLIDTVEELEPGVRAVAKKNVTYNEPYFAGHFPENGKSGRSHVRCRRNSVRPKRIVYRNTCIHKCAKPCIFLRIWHKTVIFTLLLFLRKSIIKIDFLHRFNIVFF